MLLHLVNLLGRLVKQDGSLNIIHSLFGKEVDNAFQRGCIIVEALVTDFTIVSRIILEERHCCV